MAEISLPEKLTPNANYTRSCLCPLVLTEDKKGRKMMAIVFLFSIFRLNLLNLYPKQTLSQNQEAM